MKNNAILRARITEREAILREMVDADAPRPALARLNREIETLTKLRDHDQEKSYAN